MADPIGSFFSEARMILGLMGLVFLAVGWFILKKTKDEDKALYKIQRLPPTDLHDAIDGVPVKTFSKIVCNKPAIAPYSGSQCVWSHSITEEYHEETDSKGRKHGYWQTVEDIVRTAEFQLVDPTGSICVDLNGAEQDLIRGVKVHSSEGFHMRKREYAIPVEKAFVYGMVFKDQGGLIVKKSASEPIAAATKTETEFIAEMRSDDKLNTAIGYVLGIIGALMILGALFFSFSFSPFGMLGTIMGN
ncbi:MAG: GIDE domain-containing protein [Candidatus Micrarchaeota archaeon]